MNDTPAFSNGGLGRDPDRDAARVDDELWTAVRRGAVLFFAPDRGTIAVSGSDRRSWLNGLVTSDLGSSAAFGPGVASYGLLLLKVGRILADAWVVDGGDRLFVGVPRDRVALVRDHLERHLMMEDAMHEDVSSAFTWAHVHGPDAPAAARDLATQNGGMSGALDWTGDRGALLLLPLGEGGAEGVCRAVEARFSSGESGDRGRLIGTDAAWTSLRIARGLPAWGIDFSEKHYPQEAGLEKVAVSFTKGCYLGQEVVCRLEMRGHVIKKNAMIEVDAPAPPQPGTEVRSVEGKALGAVSSAAIVPGRGSPLALAMVRYDFAEPGTPVVVGDARGRVVEQPTCDGQPRDHA